MWTRTLVPAFITTLILGQRRPVGRTPRQMDARGGTMAFNLTGGDRVVDYESFEQAARERGIAIRGG